jgi:hypothetical protein
MTILSFLQWLCTVIGAGVLTVVSVSIIGAIILALYKMIRSYVREAKNG